MTHLARTQAALQAFEGRTDDDEIADADTARAWGERRDELERDVTAAYHRDTAGEVTRTEAESPQLCPEDIDALRLLCACEDM